MSYTASQMRVATEIAYMDFDSDAVTTGASLETILKMQMEGGNEKESQRAQELLEFIRETPGCEECLQWTIRDVGDDQRNSGMYGCMIDTQDGDAIIAFRGSEASDMETFYKDWVEADLGLVNEDETKQQQKAREYAEGLYKKYPEYNHFGLTGHSLGGNLAEHVTITASDGMRDKISICMNLDGPGYSQKYIEEHYEEIMKSAHLIEHYQWSPVGTLLNPIPGTKYYSVEADGLSVFRHFTNNLHYDENGNLIVGERDWSSMGLENLSQGFDWIAYFISLGINAIKELIEKCYQEGKEKIKEILSRLYPDNYKQKKFTVQMQGMNASVNEIESYAAKMKEYRERIERIQRSITFTSATEGYIKCRLWDLTHDVENQGNKMEKMGKEGMEIFHYYKTGEMRIREYCVS